MNEKTEKERLELAEKWYELGRAAKTSEEKLNCYDKAVKLNPRFGKAWNNRGLALRKLGRYDEAIESYDKAIELNPNDKVAQKNRRILFRKWNKDDEAIESFEKTLELDSLYPNDEVARKNKAYEFYKLGRLKTDPMEKLNCYDKAIELDPELSKAWNNRGLALRKLGRYDEAIESYDKAIELNPDDKTALKNRRILLSELEDEEDWEDDDWDWDEEDWEDD